MTWIIVRNSDDVIVNRIVWDGITSIDTPADTRLVEDINDEWDMDGVLTTGLDYTPPVRAWD